MILSAKKFVESRHSLKTPIQNLSGRETVEERGLVDPGVLGEADDAA